MSQINDLEYVALGLLGFEGNLNERELAFLQGEGALSDQLNDAWLEVATGADQITEAKMIYFLANGGTGEQYNDIEKSYWLGLLVNDLAVLWFDQFTDVDATLLTAHTPDKGGTYTLLGGDLTIASNVIGASGSGGSTPNFFGGRLVGVTLPNDYDVDITYLRGANSGFVTGIGIWSNASGSVRLQCGYDGATDTVAFTLYDDDDAGTVTNGGSVGLPNVGDSIPISVRVRGDNVTIVAGSASISTTRPAPLVGQSLLSIHLRNNNSSPRFNDLKIIDRLLAPSLVF